MLTVEIIHQIFFPWCLKTIYYLQNIYKKITNSQLHLCVHILVLFHLQRRRGWNFLFDFCKFFRKSQAWPMYMIVATLLYCMILVINKTIRILILLQITKSLQVSSKLLKKMRIKNNTYWKSSGIKCITHLLDAEYFITLSLWYVTITITILWLPYVLPYLHFLLLLSLLMVFNDSGGNVNVVSNFFVQF